MAHFPQEKVSQIIQENLIPLLITGFTILALAGCGSHPIVPEGKNVKVSRDEPSKDCQDLGAVQGSVQTKSGTVEQAIEDMKLDAARKGANYVKMETASAYGSSTRGTAYFCP